MNGAQIQRKTKRQNNQHVKDTTHGSDDDERDSETRKGKKKFSLFCCFSSSIDVVSKMRETMRIEIT